MESDISKRCFPRKFIQFMVRLPKLMEHFFGCLFLSSRSGSYACSIYFLLVNCSRSFIHDSELSWGIIMCFGMVNSTLVCWHKIVKNH